MLDEKIEKTVQSTNEDKISLLTFILSEVRKSMDRSQSSDGGGPSSILAIA